MREALANERNVGQELRSPRLLDPLEANAQIRQAISVFKNRIGPHERMLRELLIDGSGVRVGDPLHDFEGILTGVPTYHGRTQMLPERGGGRD